MPRFAISMHDSPRGLHYDLFLEAVDVLKTWALPQPPAANVELECESLADHRLLYLDYEGPVSGDRGTLTAWDRGVYSVETWTPDVIVAAISGQKLTGQIELRRLAEAEDRWRFYLAGDFGRIG